MNERLLRFFIAVYEEKNLSRAAEKCFVSQPNISNGIKQLEEILGKPLFVRHKRGVELTEDAHYLYPIAKRILGELNAIPGIFKAGNFKHKVVIGVAESLPMLLKSQFFKYLNETLSNVEWDLRPISRDCELNLLVREWKFDTHLFLPLWKERYVLCVPDAHPLAKKDRIVLEDLAGVPFIHCPPCEAHQQTLSLLNTKGQKWNTVANCSSKNEVLTMLMAGMGLTFLPEYFVEHWDGFQVVPYEGPQNFREIGLSYAKENLKNPIVQKVIELLAPSKAR